METETSKKERVKVWIKSQETPPTKKEAQRAFPKLPIRLVRAAYKSAKSENTGAK